MKKQFSYADGKNINYVIIAGKDEIESGNYGLKDMRTSEQKVMTQNEIINFLKGNISE